MRCPRCHQANPARARFCTRCGMPLARPGPLAAGTRKTVTVVFADVRGATAVGGRLDPETSARLMGRYAAAMRAVVERHGGTAQSFAGDAVMAVFGIPTAHEDDALRAVRAAAGMRAALAELDRELAGGWGLRLALRAGVNSGEVVTGDAALASSLVVGDAVNVAARLQQLARPGEVLLGEATWRLVRDAATAEATAPLPMRGRRRAEPAWRLLGVAPAAAGPPRRAAAPFVGRAAELELFGWAARRVAGGAGLHLLTVLGAAGIGKSRLLAEAVGRLGGTAGVLTGRCLPYGEGITFWPLAEAVRQAAGIGLDDPLPAARAKLGGLLARAPDGALVAERVG
ncbi:MAG TPA: adenylate/guanylate cyclase domain-containing protein, partial [Actinomycetes bacterium]|nr:adenylate/guanylate cyclase domain-containing protein [Actinomycetes bacterium]